MGQRNYIVFMYVPWLCVNFTLSGVYLITYNLQIDRYFIDLKGKYSLNRILATSP